MPDPQSNLPAFSQHSNVTCIYCIAHEESANAARSRVEADFVHGPPVDTGSDRGTVHDKNPSAMTLLRRRSCGNDSSHQSKPWAQAQLASPLYLRNRR